MDRRHRDPRRLRPLPDAADDGERGADVPEPPVQSRGPLQHHSDEPDADAGQRLPGRAAGRFHGHAHDHDDLAGLRARDARACGAPTSSTGSVSAGSAKWATLDPRRAGWTMRGRTTRRPPDLGRCSHAGRSRVSAISASSIRTRGPNTTACSFARRTSISHGMNVLGTYTYSRCSDTRSSPATSTVGSEDQEPQNQNDRFDGEWGRCAIDFRHVAKMNAVYRLPFGDSLAGVARLVAADWQIGIGVNLHSGGPFNVIVSGNPANTSRGVIRPNLTGDPNLDPSERSTGAVVRHDGVQRAGAVQLRQCAAQCRRGPGTQARRPQHPEARAGWRRLGRGPPGPVQRVQHAAVQQSWTRFRHAGVRHDHVDRCGPRDSTRCADDLLMRRRDFLVRSALVAGAAAAPLSLWPLRGGRAGGARHEPAAHHGGRPDRDQGPA